MVLDEKNHCFCKSTESVTCNDQMVANSVSEKQSDTVSTTEVHQFPIANKFVYRNLTRTSAATKQKVITHSGKTNKNCSAFILNVWNPFFLVVPLALWAQKKDSPLSPLPSAVLHLPLCTTRKTVKPPKHVCYCRKKTCLCLGSYTGNDDVNVLHVKLKLSVWAAQYWDKHQSSRHNFISRWNQEVLVLTISWVSVKSKHTQWIQCVHNLHTKPFKVQICKNMSGSLCSCHMHMCSATCLKPKKKKYKLA